MPDDPIAILFSCDPGSEECNWDIFRGSEGYGDPIRAAELLRSSCAGDFPERLWATGANARAREIAGRAADERNGDRVSTENQHYPDVDAHSTGVALLKALRMWEKSGCDCCSPTVCDEAIESLGPDVELWEAFRRFGIELAQTAQNVIDEAEG